MAIDPSIALQIRPPQLDDPLTVQSKQLQLRDLMGQQQMRQMQLADAQRTQQAEMTLADLYREAAGDATKIRTGLADRGLGSRIPAFDEQQAKLGKATNENEAAKFKLAKEKLEASGAALSSLIANPQVTHQDVIGTITGLVQRGVIDPQQGQDMVRALPGRPEALRGFLMQKGMEVMDASKRIEMLTPKFEFKQTGKALVPVDTNAFTNPSPQALTMTTTPGEDLTDQRTRAEGAANRGVTMRGQNLTDARAREANDTGRALVNEKRQLEVDALKRSQDASVSATANQIAVIDKALRHPGRETATGLSGTLAPSNYVPGTDATDFRAVLDQIGGSAFLQAFESLKGGGAISEVEGKKATDAIARLSRKQSDAEFERSLKDLRQVMTTGYKRLSGKEYGGGEAPNAAPAKPKPGTVQQGYVFTGGDPGDPKSWKKQ